MISALLLDIFAFAICGALSIVWYDRKGQSLIRPDTFEDVGYLLISTVCYGQVAGWLYKLIGMPPIVSALNHAPILLQAVAVVVIYDFAQYWIHRLFHGDFLWRFHAVHHSAEEIDMLTSFRIHPVNFFFYSSLPTAALLLAGFSPVAFAVLAPFNFITACLAHANLRWTYGPFGYLLASPMFHRWHHAVREGKPSCNFAPTFPIWDLMFGTYYMPRGERPAVYGAPEVPIGLSGQLLYPFHLTGRRFDPAVSPG